MSVKTVSRFYIRKSWILISSQSLALLFLLLVTLSTAYAQNNRSETLAAADKLLAEGAQLFQQGTKASLEAAINKFEEASSLYQAVGEQAKEIRTLGGLAGCYSLLGENRKALEYLTRALSIVRGINDRVTEAMLLATIGVFNDELGEKQKALEYLNQALPIFHSSGDSDNEGLTLTGIGNVYSSMGENQKAIGYYEQALPLLRAAGDRNGEGKTLLNLGKTYSNIGEPQKAFDYYAQALPLVRATGDLTSQAHILVNSGTIYMSLGEKQKALDNFNHALPIQREVGDRGGEAKTLGDLGLVYNSVGEKQKALSYYSQALPLARAIGDREIEATLLGSIGSVYEELGEPQKALNYYTQALPLIRAVNSGKGEAFILSNMGTTYSALGDRQKALDNYTQALALLQKIGDRESQGYLLANIGAIYAGMGERQKAMDYLTQSLPLRRAVGHREGEASTLINIAKLERGRGDLSQSLARVESAVTIIESIRTNIKSQGLRSAYFATTQDAYDFYIELLMSLHNERPTEGFDKTALQVNERRRARSLLEVLAESSADVRQGVSPELLGRERTLQRKLNLKAQQQMKLLGGPHTEAQAETQSKEIDALTTELQQVEAEIRQKSPNYAALTQPQPLTLKEIQGQVLDPDTLLLEYSLGKDRSYLWAVTPTSISSYELPKRDEVEAAARRVYELLTARNKRVKGEAREQHAERVAQADKEIPAAAASLSQMVLTPVAAQLGKKRLVIVADGMLLYIPFAVLPVPSANASLAAPQPLIVEHEVVSLPSASTLSVLRREVAGRKPAPKTVVALADPVFMKNDERIKTTLNVVNSGAREAPAPLNTETVRDIELVEAAEDTGLVSGGLNIPRLPGSRKEAEEIVALLPASQRKLALDFEASRDVATSAELSQYRYVHFSTHGFLNSVHPELSGVVFSLVNEGGEAQDGFLRAHEVFNLKLSAEVVVLSACQTGIGREVKGEGLVSLTRGFMYAGAPRVVVSLWSVNEWGTTELMVRFYREMLKGGKRPAAALRAAQVSLMKEKKWQSPFYWGAFTLQGEWR
jgi:CHAT domain-containing protein/Tfp pilus assembly protein PilF